jgi:hypothetical protein
MASQTNLFDKWGQVPPQGHHGPQDAILVAGWTPADRELTQSLRKRAGRAAQMLERLRRGPATTWELMQLGGAGFSSRLRELRNAGHRIVAEGGPDEWVYRLEG